jgi:uncharacterized protein (UPF0332 family)
MTPSEYLAKAARAVASARLLLADGDTDGACNRAYYAMFDAAHAALSYTKSISNRSIIKTHNGLISAVGQHLVKPGVLSAELGRSLNQVEHIRLLADYMNEPVPAEKAQWAIEQAELFVQSTQYLLANHSV